MEEDYWGMEEETEISRDEAGEQESSGTISYEITRVAKIQPDGSPSADGFEEKDIITLNERQLREYYDEVAQSASWTEDLRDLLKLPLADATRLVTTALRRALRRPLASGNPACERIARLRRLHPSWKFAVSPSGEYLAMLDETKLTIFSRDKWSCRESTWTVPEGFTESSASFRIEHFQNRLIQWAPTGDCVGVVLPGIVRPLLTSNGGEAARTPTTLFLVSIAGKELATLSFPQEKQVMGSDTVFSCCLLLQSMSGEQDEAPSALPVRRLPLERQFSRLPPEDDWEDTTDRRPSIDAVATVKQLPTVLLFTASGRMVVVQPNYNGEGGSLRITKVDTALMEYHTIVSKVIVLPSTSSMKLAVCGRTRSRLPGSKTKDDIPKYMSLWTVDQTIQLQFQGVEHSHPVYREVIAKRNKMNIRRVWSRAFNPSTVFATEISSSEDGTMLAFLCSNGDVFVVESVSLAVKSAFNYGGALRTGTSQLRLSSDFANFAFEVRGESLLEGFTSAGLDANLLEDRFIDVSWWDGRSLLLSSARGGLAVVNVQCTENLLSGGLMSIRESADKTGETYPLARLSAVHKTQAGGRRALVFETAYHRPTPFCKMYGFEVTQDEGSKRGLLYAPIRLAAKGLRFAGFMRDDALPADAAKELFSRVWRTVRIRTLAETTPPEMMSYQIEAGFFDLAEETAERYGLDKDPVYKARWSQSKFDHEAIVHKLRRVKDKVWILQECFCRTPKSSTAMIGLLDEGLRLTNVRSVNRTIVSEEDGSVLPLDSNMELRLSCRGACLVLARLLFLNFKDRLSMMVAVGSFESENGTTYDPHAFESFRMSGIVDIASFLARRAARLKSLKSLLAHSVQQPSLLYLFKHDVYDGILKCIPETVDPSEYKALLPNCFQDDREAWEKFKVSVATSLPGIELKWKHPSRIDWSEHPVVLRELSRHMTYSEFSGEYSIVWNAIVPTIRRMINGDAGGPLGYLRNLLQREQEPSQTVKVFDSFLTEQRIRDSWSISATLSFYAARIKEFDANAGRIDFSLKMSQSAMATLNQPTSNDAVDSAWRSFKDLLHCVDDVHELVYDMQQELTLATYMTEDPLKRLCRFCKPTVASEGGTAVSSPSSLFVNYGLPHLRRWSEQVGPGTSLVASRGTNDIAKEELSDETKTLVCKLIGELMSSEQYRDVNSIMKLFIVEEKADKRDDRSEGQGLIGGRDFIGHPTRELLCEIVQGVYVSSASADAYCNDMENIVNTATDIFSSTIVSEGQEKILEAMNNHVKGLEILRQYNIIKAPRDFLSLNARSNNELRDIISEVLMSFSPKKRKSNLMEIMRNPKDAWNSLLADILKLREFFSTTIFMQYPLVLEDDQAAGKTIVEFVERVVDEPPADKKYSLSTEETTVLVFKQALRAHEFEIAAMLSTSNETQLLNCPQKVCSAILEVALIDLSAATSPNDDLLTGALSCTGVGLDYMSIAARKAQKGLVNGEYTEDDVLVLKQQLAKERDFIGAVANLGKTLRLDVVPVRVKEASAEEKIHMITSGVHKLSTGLLPEGEGVERGSDSVDKALAASVFSPTGYQAIADIAIRLGCFEKSASKNAIVGLIARIFGEAGISLVRSILGSEHSMRIGSRLDENLLRLRQVFSFVCSLLVKRLREGDKQVLQPICELCFDGRLWNLAEEIADDSTDEEKSAAKRALALLKVRGEQLKTDLVKSFRTLWKQGEAKFSAFSKKVTGLEVPLATEKLDDENDESDGVLIDYSLDTRIELLNRIAVLTEDFISEKAQKASELLQKLQILLWRARGLGKEHWNPVGDCIEETLALDLRSWLSDSAVTPSIDKLREAVMTAVLEDRGAVTFTRDDANDPHSTALRCATAMAAGFSIDRFDDALPLLPRIVEDYIESDAAMVIPTIASSQNIPDAIRLLINDHEKQAQDAGTAAEERTTAIDSHVLLSLATAALQYADEFQPSLAAESAEAKMLVQQVEKRVGTTERRTRAVSQMSALLPETDTNLFTSSPEYQLKALSAVCLGVKGTRSASSERGRIVALSADAEEAFEIAATLELDTIQLVLLHLKALLAPSAVADISAKEYMSGIGEGVEESYHHKLESLPAEEIPLLEKRTGEILPRLATKAERSLIFLANNVYPFIKGTDLPCLRVFFHTCALISQSISSASLKEHLPVFLRDFELRHREISSFFHRGGYAKIDFRALIEGDETTFRRSLHDAVTESNYALLQEKLCEMDAAIAMGVNVSDVTRILLEKCLRRIHKEGTDGDRARRVWQSMKGKMDYNDVRPILKGYFERAGRPAQASFVLQHVLAEAQERNWEELVPVIKDWDAIVKAVDVTMNISDVDSIRYAMKRSFSLQSASKAFNALFFNLLLTTQNVTELRSALEQLRNVTTAEACPEESITYAVKESGCDKALLWAVVECVKQCTHTVEHPVPRSPGQKHWPRAVTSDELLSLLRAVLRRDRLAPKHSTLKKLQQALRKRLQDFVDDESMDPEARLALSTCLEEITTETDELLQLVDAAPSAGETLTKRERRVSSERKITDGKAGDLSHFLRASSLVSSAVKDRVSDRCFMTPQTLSTNMAAILSKTEGNVKLVCATTVALIDSSFYLCEHVASWATSQAEACDLLVALLKRVLSIKKLPTVVTAQILMAFTLASLKLGKTSWKRALSSLCRSFTSPLAKKLYYSTTVNKGTLSSPTSLFISLPRVSTSTNALTTVKAMVALSHAVLDEEWSLVMELLADHSQNVKEDCIGDVALFALACGRPDNVLRPLLRVIVRKLNADGTLRDGSLLSPVEYHLPLSGKALIAQFFAIVLQRKEFNVLVEATKELYQLQAWTVTVSAICSLVLAAIDDGKSHLKKYEEEEDENEKEIVSAALLVWKKAEQDLERVLDEQKSYKIQRSDF